MYLWKYSNIKPDFRHSHERNFANEGGQSFALNLEIKLKKNLVS